MKALPGFAEDQRRLAALDHSRAIPAVCDGLLRGWTAKRIAASIDPIAHQDCVASPRKIEIACHAIAGPADEMQIVEEQHDVAGAVHRAQSRLESGEKGAVFCLDCVGVLAAKRESALVPAVRVWAAVVLFVNERSFCRSTCPPSQLCFGYWHAKSVRGQEDDPKPQDGEQCNSSHRTATVPRTADKPTMVLSHGGDTGTRDRRTLGSGCGVDPRGDLGDVGCVDGIPLFQRGRVDAERSGRRALGRWAGLGECDIGGPGRTPHRRPPSRPRGLGHRCQVSVCSPQRCGLRTAGPEISLGVEASAWRGIRDRWRDARSPRFVPAKRGRKARPPRCHADDWAYGRSDLELDSRRLWLIGSCPTIEVGLRARTPAPWPPAKVELGQGHGEDYCLSGPRRGGAMTVEQAIPIHLIFKARSHPGRQAILFTMKDQPEEAFSATSLRSANVQEASYHLKQLVKYRCVEFVAERKVRGTRELFYRLKDDERLKSLQQPSGPQGLMKGMSHPLRLGVLRLLNKRPASPVEMSRDLHTTSGEVDHHVKDLVKLGCVELLERRRVEGSSALENVYRMTQTTQQAIREFYVESLEQAQSDDLRVNLVEKVKSGEASLGSAFEQTSRRPLRPRVKQLPSDFARVADHLERAYAELDAIARLINGADRRSAVRDSLQGPPAAPSSAPDCERTERGTQPSEAERLELERQERERTANALRSTAVCECSIRSLTDDEDCCLSCSKPKLVREVV